MNYDTARQSLQEILRIDSKLRYVLARAKNMPLWMRIEIGDSIGIGEQLSGRLLEEMNEDPSTA